MAKCEVCGNDYHLAFQVVTASETHTFDCFECAVQKLAPVCDYCGVRVTGHGVEKSGAFYCGATLRERRARPKRMSGQVKRRRLV